MPRTTTSSRTLSLSISLTLSCPFQIFPLDILLTRDSQLSQGVLHTIFFHRFFPALTPGTRDVLDLTLPHVDDVELETMIEQRTTALLRQLESPDQQQYFSSRSGAGGGRGQVTVQFFEKKRRKAWIMSRGDEEVCWETWTIRVTVAEPRTESGRSCPAHIICSPPTVLALALHLYCF